MDAIVGNDLNIAARVAAGTGDAPDAGPAGDSHEPGAAVGRDGRECRADLRRYAGAARRIAEDRRRANWSRCSGRPAPARRRSCGFSPASIFRPPAASCSASEDALRLSVQERNVGFVFQNYALFRHMTVFDNVAFGLDRARCRPPPGQGRDRAPRSRASRTRPARRSREALSRAAFRRPAPARRARPRARHRAAHPAARRTLRRARREGAQGTAPLAARNPRSAPATPRSSSPTTRKRRSNSPTASSSSTRGESSRSAPPTRSTTGRRRRSSPASSARCNALPVTVETGNIFLDDRELGLANDGGPDGPRTLVFRPHDVVFRDDGVGGIAGFVVSELRHGPTRRLAVEVGLRRHRIEVDVAADTAPKKGNRVVILPRRWRLFRPDDFEG